MKGRAVLIAEERKVGQEEKMHSTDQIQCSQR